LIVGKQLLNDRDGESGGLAAASFGLSKDVFSLQDGFESEFLDFRGVGKS
jgi:hypothetical protein